MRRSEVKTRGAAFEISTDMQYFTFYDNRHMTGQVEFKGKPQRVHIVGPQDVQALDQRLQLGRIGCRYRRVLRDYKGLFSLTAQAEVTKIEVPSPSDHKYFIDHSQHRYQLSLSSFPMKTFKLTFVGV